MVRDGIPFAVVPLLIALACAALGFWLVWFWIAVVIFILVAGFMVYFFRDPRRSIPLEPGIVLAPADGKVTIARQSTPENPDALVSIFLSPLDVHINRSPIEG